PFEWHCTARAIEPCRAVALNAASLLIRAEEDPVFGYELMKRVSRQVVKRLQTMRTRLIRGPKEARNAEISICTLFFQIGGRPELCSAARCNRQNGVGTPWCSHCHEAVCRSFLKSPSSWMLRSTFLLCGSSACQVTKSWQWARLLPVE